MTCDNQVSDHLEGSGILKEKSCFNCREGFIMGENVYCNLDGQFHLPVGSFECKNYIPKIRKRKLREKRIFT